MTDPGTVNAGLLFVKVIRAPPAGATFVSVTVHVVEPFGATVDGLHDNEDTNTGATRLTVVFAEPLL